MNGQILIEKVYNMHVRFLTPKTQIDVPLCHPGLKNNWNLYYQAPWPLIYHLLELGCLIFFFFFVTTPTIDFCFLNRQVFVDAFYPDYEYPDEPLTTLNEITDYFESVNESIDSFITDSFMDIYISTRQINNKISNRISNVIIKDQNKNYNISTERNQQANINEEVDWPILCEILFLNGTKIFRPLDLDEMDFDLSFFYHLSYIIISVDFYVFSKSPKVPGCSRWQIQSKIYAKEGFSQFSIIPSISRIQCNKSFIASREQTKKFIEKLKLFQLKLQNESITLKNNNQEATIKKRVTKSIHPSFRTEMQRIKKRRLRKKNKKTPKYKKRYNLHMKMKKPNLDKSIFNLKTSEYDKLQDMYQTPTEFYNRQFNRKSQNKPTKFNNDQTEVKKGQNLQKNTENHKNEDDDDDDDDHIIYQESLKIYRMTKFTSFILTVISSVHLIVLCVRFRSSFKTHIEWTVTHNEYRLLPTLTQFHFTIGYWPLIDFISTIVVLISSVFMHIDNLSMTQFPSQGSIEFVSVSMFISFIRFSQWLGAYLPFYQLTIILREAFMRLFYLVVGILPIVTGLSLFGIFLFGFIEDSYETFRYLVQRMITSGMGDSIDDFFIITDDGTDATAWISFFYVGIITALGMWIVFTSCIATVSYVHQNSIVAENSSLMSESTSAIANYSEEILMN